MLPDPLYDTVAIAGMGLLGGSLGLALRERGLARRVVGIVRREETARQAVALGAADASSTDPAAGVRDADLVVAAVPVLSIPPLVAAMAASLRPGTVVTDVGSTKLELERRLPPLLPAGVEFVGGHPMAGSEQAGIAAARADLFEGATYVLTLPPGGRPAALERLAKLASALGAIPLEMNAAEHDAAVARISHLPHVVAASLAAAARDPRQKEAVLRRLSAGGFRDSTRVAASPAEMWRDVCLTNAAPLLAALDDYQERLARFRRAIAEADGETLAALFDEGQEARRALMRADQAKGEAR